MFSARFHGGWYANIGTVTAAAGFVLAITPPIPVADIKPTVPKVTAAIEVHRFTRNSTFPVLLVVRLRDL
jgi:hypothetical protein